MTRLGRLGLVLVLLLMAAPAAARTVAQADLDQNGFKLYGIPLAPDRASSAVSLRFVTPGVGYLLSTGLDGTLSANPTIPYAAISGAPAAITALHGDAVATGPGDAALVISANAVTSAKFRQSAPFSIPGNPTSGTANVQDIICSADGQFYGRVAGALTCTSAIASTSTVLAATLVGYGSPGNALTGSAGFSFTSATSLGRLIGDATIGAPGMAYRRSEGSIASPTAILNTSYIGKSETFEAYDGTSFLATVQVGAHVIPSATVAGGSVPSEFYVAAAAAGVGDPYGSNLVIPVRAKATYVAFGTHPNDTLKASTGVEFRGFGSATGATVIQGPTVTLFPSVADGTTSVQRQNDGSTIGLADFGNGAAAPVRIRSGNQTMYWGRSGGGVGWGITHSLQNTFQVQLTNAATTTPRTNWALWDVDTQLLEELFPGDNISIAGDLALDVYRWRGQNPVFLGGVNTHAAGLNFHSFEAGTITGATSFISSATVWVGGPPAGTGGPTYGLHVAGGSSTTSARFNGNVLAKGATGVTVDALGTAMTKSVAGVLTPAVSGTDFAPAGNYITNLTGDVVANGPGSVPGTIQSNVVGNTKLADMATQTFKGRTTAGTSDPEDLTATQATAMLNVGTSTLKGLVPPSGGGTTNFLRADFTWAPPPAGGGGTVTSVAGTIGRVSATGTTSVVIDLVTTAVTPNSYTYGSFTVDAYGRLTAASNGATPEVPLTFINGARRTGNNVAVDLTTGVSGGQSVVGGTGASNDLTLSSTTNATKGRILIGGTATSISEVTGAIIVGGAAAVAPISVTPNAATAALHFAVGTADSGGYLISTAADQGIMAGGATFNGVNWVAKATDASLVYAGTSGITLYSNTGLTPGSTYTPTARLVVDGATGGVTVSNLVGAGNALVKSVSGLLTAATTADYVPPSRTISTSGPIRIDGTTSADLSANRTLSAVVPSSHRVLSGNAGGTDFVASDEIRIDDGSDLFLVSNDGAAVWRDTGGSGMIGAVNYDQVKAYISGADFLIQSQVHGLGVSYRNIVVDAATANVRLAGNEVRSSTLTGGGLVYTPPGSNGELLNTTPSAEFAYFVQVTTGTIGTLNVADQYIATSSYDTMFGSTAIEYPVAKTLPTFGRVEACLVGTNTITSGEVSICPTVNGSGGITLTFSSASTGCQRASTSNFGGTASDKVGVQLCQSSGLGGRNTATLSGTLRLTVKTRWQGYSTF